MEWNELLKNKKFYPKLLSNSHSRRGHGGPVD